MLKPHQENQANKAPFQLRFQLEVREETNAIGHQHPQTITTKDPPWTPEQTRGVRNRVLSNARTQAEIVE